MKIKIDECIPQECSTLLHQKGYNTETVYQEGLLRRLIQDSGLSVNEFVELLGKSGKRK